MLDTMLTATMDLARAATLLAFPHGGQQRARTNALAGVRDVRERAALQAEATDAVARAVHPSARRLVR